MNAYAIDKYFDMVHTRFLEIGIEEPEGEHCAVEYSCRGGWILELRAFNFRDFLPGGTAEDDTYSSLSSCIRDDIHDDVHLGPYQGKLPGIDVLPHANDGGFACCIHESIIAQENPIDRCHFIPLLIIIIWLFQRVIFLKIFEIRAIHGIFSLR